MINDFLQLYGLSIGILEELSFESKLGISLKNNLHYFDKTIIMNELQEYCDWLDDKEILSELSIDYRVKSLESIMNKYDRYFPDHQLRKVFNDVLGFRALSDSYYDFLTIKDDRFRIADMSAGKAIDDGYRGVHLYFQKNPRCYPIEIQFNTYYDRQLNDWLHEYVYKREYPSSVGCKIRSRYEIGEIRNIDEFKEALKQCVI